MTCEEAGHERVVGGGEQVQRDGTAQAAGSLGHDHVPQSRQRLVHQPGPGRLPREAVVALRFQHRARRVQVQRLHGPEVREEAVVQQRHVLKRQGAKRPLTQSGDRAHSIAVYQHREVRQRVQLACRLRCQETGKRLSVHLRCRTVWER